MKPGHEHDPDVVKVRLLGPVALCRELLDQLAATVQVVHVDGPFVNRRAPGVRVYAYVKVRKADALPGDGTSGNVALVGVEET